MQVDKRKFGICAAVCLIYLITALFMFPNVATHITSVVPSNSSDTYEALWDLWWTKYSILTLHSNVYATTSDIFYPIGMNTVYEAMSPIAGFVSIPLQLISIALAYNVLFFFGFVLTGLAGFVLCEYITRNTLASFLGGFFFTFSAFHLSFEFFHLQLFDIGWVAFFIYFFIRAADGAWEGKYAVLAGISFVLVVFMDEVEEGLFVILFSLLIIAFYLVWKETRSKIMSKRFLKFIAIMLCSAFIAGSWGFIPLLMTILAPGGLAQVTSYSSLSDNIAFSSNLLSFFVPNYYFYGNTFQDTKPNLLYDTVGGSTYIGYTVILLACYGVYKNRKKSGLWIFLGVSAFWLALGPYIQIGQLTSITGAIPGVFLLLHSAPIFDIIREPQRFDLVASLAFSVLAALGAAEALARIGKVGGDSRRNRYALTAFLCLVFVLETFGLPIPPPANAFASTYIPPFILQMNTIPGNFSFLVLPATLVKLNYRYNGLAQYYQTAAQKSLVGGAVTRETQQEGLTVFSMPLIAEATYLATYDNLSYYTPPYASPVNENYTLQSLKTLDDYHTAFIVLVDNAYTQKAFYAVYNLLNSTFGEPVYYDSNITVFSTTKALKDNVYRQFISYFEPGDWTQVIASFNGTDTALWTPTNRYGVIIDYAPYLRGNITQSTSYVNATMTFDAFAQIPQQLAVGYYPVVANAAHYNYSFYLGTQPRQYSINLRLAPGPTGNLVFFDAYLQNHNESDSVFIDNITFNNRYNQTD